MKKNKKNVVLLGTTSFFNDISSEAIFTLLPLYIQSPGLLGLIGGIISGLGDIIKVYFGYLSDHIGRRRIIIWVGYLFSAIAKLIIPFVITPFIIILLIIDRIGKGIREGPRDAILSFSKHKGWAFGLQKAMDTFGAVVGGLIAFVFVLMGGGYQGAMIFVAILGLFALLPLTLIEHTHVDKNPLSFRKTIKGMSHGMGWFLLATSVFGVVMISPLLLIREAYLELGNLGILVYVLFNIVYAFSAKLIGENSDKLGRTWGMNLSFLSAAIAFLAVFYGGWLVIIGFMMYGVAMGAFNSVSRALVSELFTKHTATAQGIFQTTFGLAVLVGSSIFGLSLGTIGKEIYLVGILFSLLAAVIFNYWRGISKIKYLV
ncbi:MAG: MFS transporter [Candidatus Altiarchaeota archaeon]|nr:MFS transporter [Candidatus Altiarchaeota archaeon]